MENLSRCRSSIVGPRGELLFGGGGGRLWKITGLGRKPQPLCLHECEALATLRHIYLGYFLWTLRTLEVWIWGQCGTSLEGQGSHDSGLGRGHKGPARPTFRGTARARPTLILFCSILWSSLNSQEHIRNGGKVHVKVRFSYRKNYGSVFRLRTCSHLPNRTMPNADDQLN
jgi:hypothetical protein